MAKQVLAQQDFNWIELLKVRVQSLSSAPGSPQPGWVYYDTTLNKLRVCTNATGPVWVNLDGSDIPDSTITSAKINDGAIMNVDINASAAIAKTKLAALNIVDADVAGGAAIAYSKLALTGAILNADLAGSIANTKLATDPLARANHTGTQTVSTLSDYAAATLEIAQDAVGALIGAGGAVITYDDAGTGLTTLTITNNEAFQDVVGAFLAVTTGNSGITVTYDDAANRMTFVVTDSPTVAGNTPAQLRDRTTHTGTQASATISDLATVVKGYRLDEFVVPNADISLNTHKLTNVTDPTNPQDAATKNYVDLARQGIRLKDSVVAASTVNLTLSGTQTVDGVALVALDRVLVKNQTTASQNGIYVVAAGAWARATDADTFQELNDGATVWVNQGGQGNTTWAQINTLTALSDNQSWTQQGAAASYIGGAGILLTGQTFDIGAGTGISVGTDTVAIDTAVVARKYTTTIGNGAATSIAVNHALANQWVTVQVFRATTPYDLIDCEVELTDANNATVKFATAPTAAQYRAVVTG